MRRIIPTKCTQFGVLSHTHTHTHIYIYIYHAHVRRPNGAAMLNQHQYIKASKLHMRATTCSPHNASG